MAENKKSFVLYADLIHTVRKFSPEKAGELFLHILSYVNDENPQADDILIEIAFEPIKQQLKRDLQKWELLKEKRSKAGKLGGLKSGEIRQQNEANEANASFAKQNEANEAVNDNVNVNVNVNDNVIINNNIEREVEKNVVDDAPASQPPPQRKSLDEKIADRKVRESKFYQQLAEFKDEFPKEMLRAFYDYWREPNKSGTKMKYELEKTWDLSRRLARWQNQERSFNKTSSNEPPQTAIDPRIAAKLQTAT